MLEKAINKIKDEMRKDKNQYVQVVGGFLLEYVSNNPIAAEKILDDKKTIASSLNIMMKEAEKKRVGNGAVLAYEEGLNIVLKYFDIQQDKELNINAPVKEEIKKESSSVEFKVSLDEYLDF